MPQIYLMTRQLCYIHEKEIPSYLMSEPKQRDNKTWNLSRLEDNVILPNIKSRLHVRLTHK